MSADRAGLVLDQTALSQRVELAREERLGRRRRSGAGSRRGARRRAGADPGRASRGALRRERASRTRRPGCGRTRAHRANRARSRAFRWRRVAEQARGRRAQPEHVAAQPVALVVARAVTRARVARDLVLRDSRGPSRARRSRLIASTVSSSGRSSLPASAARANGVPGSSVSAYAETCGTPRSITASTSRSSASSVWPGAP